MSPSRFSPAEYGSLTALFIVASQRRGFKAEDRLADVARLQEFVVALNDGSADVRTLKDLALFCMSHPSTEPISPLSTSLSIPASPSPLQINLAGSVLHKGDIWTADKNFDKLFKALEKFLQQPERVCLFTTPYKRYRLSTPIQDEELLEYALIVLWEMLEHLPSPMEGRETDVFGILLRVRYSNRQAVRLLPYILFNDDPDYFC